MGKPTVEMLRERARGQVITVSDAEYEAARKVYNGMIDRRPRVVVRAQTSPTSWRPLSSRGSRALICLSAGARTACRASARTMAAS